MNTIKLTIDVTVEQAKRIMNILEPTAQAKYNRRKRASQELEVPDKPKTDQLFFVAYYINKDDGLIYFDEFKDAEAMSKQKSHDYKPIGFMTKDTIATMKKDLLFVYDGDIKKLLKAYGVAQPVDK